LHHEWSLPDYVYWETPPDLLDQQRFVSDATVVPNLRTLRGSRRLVISLAGLVMSLAERRLVISLAGLVMSLAERRLVISLAGLVISLVERRLVISLAEKMFFLNPLFIFSFQDDLGLLFSGNGSAEKDSSVEMRAMKKLVQTNNMHKC
jgi:hypothetical protein